jgi:pimeloyl-ACP methyl ester carboxylesterase
MGGYISLPFAAANPDRVEKLVLAHTSARADTDAERAARNDMIEALDSEGIRILPARMLPRLLGPNASPQAQQFVKDAIQRTGIQAAIHAVSAMRDRPDATARLAQISCPALVIAGDADAIMKIEDAEAMAAGMPQGRLAVIPNSGHLSNLEEPELFNRTLAEFLDFGPLSRVES